MENKKVEFAIKILKQYADENGEIVRGTTDTSPLEQWLIMRLYKASQLEPLVILRELEYWKNAIKGAIDQIDEAEDDGRMEDSLASSLRFVLGDYGLEKYCKSK